MFYIVVDIVRFVLFGDVILNFILWNVISRIKEEKGKKILSGLY